MMCRSFTSQKGFSLIRILLIVIILGIVALYVIPNLPAPVQPLKDRITGIVNAAFGRATGVKTWLVGKWEAFKIWIGEKYEDIKDWWIRKDLFREMSKVAIYKFSEKSFEGLKKDDVPEEVVASLRTIKEEFPKEKEDEFLAAVEERIGEDALKEYGSLILEHAQVTFKEIWQKGLNRLIRASKTRGFRMSKTEGRRSQYENEEASWRRVENEFWREIRGQTQATIEQSFDRFRTRPLGCSDFAVEMQMIWNIVQNFNKDEWDGYVEAKMLSERLQQPRSQRFLIELLEWLTVAKMYSSPAGNLNNDWRVQQLKEATVIKLTRDSLKKLEQEGIPENILLKLEILKDKEYVTEGEFLTALRTTIVPLSDRDKSLILQYSKPNYPFIIQQIDSRPGSGTYLDQMDRILRDIVIAEIYLNNDLINPAEDRFDEAIRNLSVVAAHYHQHNPYTMTSLGLHMALGLLHERVCKNVDLAIKEFKEVVAIATRLGLPCRQYSIAHFHLGVINMNLRIGPEAKPVFEEASSSHSDTIKDIAKATPTPEPTATPVPAATPTPWLKVEKIKKTIEVEEIRIGREIPQPPGEREERPVEEETPTEAPTEAPTETPSEPGAPTPVSIEPETTDVIKGVVQVPREERDIRLYPRKEVGETSKMKFDVNDLYDLSKIPDDAAREFELYLKCINLDPENRATIARFVHDKYMGK